MHPTYVVSEYYVGAGTSGVKVYFVMGMKAVLTGVHQEVGISMPSLAELFTVQYTNQAEVVELHDGSLPGKISHVLHSFYFLLSAFV